MNITEFKDTSWLRQHYADMYPDMSKTTRAARAGIKDAVKAAAEWHRILTAAGIESSSFDIPSAKIQPTIVLDDAERWKLRLNILKGLFAGKKPGVRRYIAPAGGPGAGKSTWIKGFLGETNPSRYIHFDTTDIAHQLPEFKCMVEAGPMDPRFSASVRHEISPLRHAVLILATKYRFGIIDETVCPSLQDIEERNRRGYQLNLPLILAPAPLDYLERTAKRFTQSGMLPPPDFVLLRAIDAISRHQEIAQQYPNSGPIFVNRSNKLIMSGGLNKCGFYDEEGQPHYHDGFHTLEEHVARLINFAHLFEINLNLPPHQKSVLGGPAKSPERGLSGLLPRQEKTN